MTYTAFFLLGVVVGALGALTVWVRMRDKKARLEERLLAAQRENEAAAVRVAALEQNLREKETGYAAAAAAKEKELREILEAKERETRKALAAKDVAREEVLNKLGRADIRVKELETTLEKERRATREQLALLDEATNTLRDTFKALSAEALHSNNDAFLKLARETLAKTQTAAVGELDARRKAVETLVKPLGETLGRYEKQLAALEKDRREAYGGLREQLKETTRVQEKLKEETGNLVQALRKPHVRGRWGELTLRRAVELTGMAEHCDFEEQVDFRERGAAANGALRPDLVIYLPAARRIVVDAKAPLEAFLDATEAADEKARETHLDRLARHFREHVRQLSGKEYWKKVAGSLDFVVMFVPSEAVFEAVLKREPGLLEEAADRHVLLTSPASLIALLKAVAHGFRREKLAENAQRIAERGRELYERLRVMTGHFADLRKALQRSVEAHDRIIGSLEARVLPAARELRVLGVTAAEGETDAAKGELSRPERLGRLPRELRLSDDDAPPAG